VTSGIGLAFVTYPVALSLMPAGHFWAVLLFILLSFAALTSIYGVMEACAIAVKDKWQITKSKAVWIVCGSAAVVSLWFLCQHGLFWLDIVDNFLCKFGMVSVGIIECLVIGWILGAKKLRMFSDAQSEFRVGPFFDFLIKYLTLLILLVPLALSIKDNITSPYGGYPAWAVAVGAGYVLVVLPIVAILLARARGREAE